MAIKNIKEIINNKGYVIDPRDRKIFEDGDLQSFFGFSNTDSIEFIIYDINDNQLPQLDGKLVRYINLTDENIRDYFLIPEGTLVQQFSLPTEYFIDVERLLQEAGYSNGIFKTQVTLINKRAGSDKEFDKLWIQEISPSRNEIRLFPLKKGVEINSELKRRFEIFVTNNQFREDVIQIAFELIEQVSSGNIVSFLKDKYGERWFKKFIDEFKINDLQSLATKINESFVKSAIFEFTNRNSKIGTSEYGTNKLVNPPLSLTKNDVIITIKRILIETIYYYLPERDINSTLATVNDFIQSEDFVSDVLQREESDTEINPVLVEIDQIDVVKKNNPVREYLVNGVTEEIKEDPTIPDEVRVVIVTPDGYPDYYDDFPEFPVDDVIEDRNIPTPIEEDNLFDPTQGPGIELGGDRVNIPTTVVVNGQTFEITPLPVALAGGSPVSGEGSQGNQPLGSRRSNSQPLGSDEFSNPQDAVQNEYQFRSKKLIREL
jgi:hypothetical protein